MNDINNIPRYGAHFPLQTVFITNADKSGDHIFKQLKRDGNICIYSRTRVEDGKLFGFEVVIAKHIKAGSPLPGGATVENDYESYPGAQAFGRTAWFVPTLQTAEKKFKQVIEHHTHVENEAVEETVIVPIAKVTKEKVTTAPGFDIPKGEFTQADFATQNCLPLRGTVYNHIQDLVKKGLIKVSRREKRGPGKPTVLYVKA